MSPATDHDAGPDGRQLLGPHRPCGGLLRAAGVDSGQKTSIRASRGIDALPGRSGRPAGHGSGDWCRGAPRHGHPSLRSRRGSADSTGRVRPEAARTGSRTTGQARRAGRSGPQSSSPEPAGCFQGTATTSGYAPWPSVRPDPRRGRRYAATLIPATSDGCAGGQSTAGAEHGTSPGNPQGRVLAGGPARLARADERRCQGRRRRVRLVPDDRPRRRRRDSRPLHHCPLVPAYGLRTTCTGSRPSTSGLGTASSPSSPKPWRRPCRHRRAAPLSAHDASPQLRDQFEADAWTTPPATTSTARWRSAIEARPCAEQRFGNVYDLSPETTGRFDLVFCGACSHVSDPLRALYAIRSVTRESAIIATAIHWTASPPARGPRRPGSQPGL